MTDRSASSDAVVWRRRRRRRRRRREKAKNDRGMKNFFDTRPNEKEPPIISPKLYLSPL